MTHRSRLSSCLLALALASTLALPLGAALPPSSGGVLPALPAPIDDVLPSRPPCERITGISLIQGNMDTFDESDGLEAATPRWALTTWMASASASPRRDYDDHRVNRLFGTTFSPLPANVLGGTLTIHVRPEGDLYYNDGFAVGFDGASFTVSSGFAAWTNRAPAGPWLAGTEYDIYVPLTPALVQQMNDDGFLDVYAQDDTNVDWITLDLRYCECERVERGSMLQGEVDGYDPASQPATTPRGPDFNVWLGASRAYDQKGVNRLFKTSFTGLPDHLLTLTVTVHLRGEGELDDNDGIALQFHSPGNTFSWGSALSAFGPWPGDLTFSIPVDALNGGAVLADVNDDHWLDVYVQDDTNVDWIQLNYTYCKCLDVRARSYQGGVHDNFATGNGPEPTTARPAFTTAQTQYPLRTFDSSVIDSQFAYSFTGLPGNILSATLEIRMRPVSSLSSTDYLQLQWTGSGFVWGIGMNALYGGTWDPWNAAPTTFTLDLATMPGMLQSMNSTNWLDVYVADDSDVDYVRLHIEYCYCPPLPVVTDPVECVAPAELSLLQAAPSGHPGGCVSTGPGVPDSACPPACIDVPVAPAGPGQACDPRQTADRMGLPRGHVYCLKPDPARAPTVEKEAA